MEKLIKVLSGAYEIVGKSIAVISKKGTYIFPSGSSISISYDEASKHNGENYKGYNIYRHVSDGAPNYICIQSDKYFESEATELILMLIKLSSDNGSMLHEAFRKAVEGKNDTAGMIKLEEYFKDFLPGYIILIDGYKDYKDETQEILINTINTKFCFEYDGRIVAAVEEEDIEEVCGSYIKNILSELLIECTVVIGGWARTVKELKEKYEDSLKALYFKDVFSLSDSVINYENMYGCRIVHDLSPKIKEYIESRVFTEEFNNIMNSETGITIEEFFKNNLNLTDTAAKLYIHRNTLLYRLDKIQKSTGFDLRKFEDSWLFRLAWLIRKEKER